MDETRFTRRWMPWLIAAAAVLLYMLTLNHWMSFASMPQVARVSGWEWRPNIFQPLYFLLTLPLKLLPESLLPLALNVLSAVCGALVLALLARCVLLLPHDRTHEQRQREGSDFSLLSIRAWWLPPVLAATVCGLQLTFWENATAASTEMLDLLVFAYCVRCLLEFRIERRDSWMMRFAFVYGLGIANNWAMLGFLPAFLLAAVWIIGVRFFNGQFLLRMSLLGLAGLAILAILPAITALNHPSSGGFGGLVENILSTYKLFLSTVFKTFMRTKQLWVMCVPVLALLIIGIRWASYFGDTSQLGIIVATGMFHLLHGVLLLVSLWFALDPAFSPRILPERLGISFQLPFLTLYFLNALCVGYFTGYFLLVFGKTRRQRGSDWTYAVGPFIRGAVWMLALLAPLGLIAKNLGQIRYTNGPWLSRYTAAMVETLPKTGAFVLSDDARRLFLADTFLRRTGNHDHIFLSTADLPSPSYHKVLAKRYAQPLQHAAIAATNIQACAAATNLLDPSVLVPLLLSFSEARPIYYLHPSFGYYFEQFYMKPHGLTYELIPYQTNLWLPPRISPELIAQNDDFWKHLNSDVLDATVSINSARHKNRLTKNYFATLLRPEANYQSVVLGAYASRSLNHYAVELQRAGQNDKAHPLFERAVELNPENVVAQVNAAFNKNLHAGEKAPARVSPSVQELFSKYRDPSHVVNEYGPFDEPTFCFEQGRLYARHNLIRQAAQQFERVRQLSPDNITGRIWLGYLANSMRRPETVLELVREVRAIISENRAQTNVVDVAILEASAHLSLKQPERAHEVIGAALDALPQDTTLLAAACQIYMLHGDYPHALALAEKHLALSPDNPAALNNQSFALIQLGEYDQAIPPLTRLLTVQTNDYRALFNRALAYLRGDKLDAARQDYEALQKVFPNAYQLHYGLGEIAYRKHDTNAAISHYENYLHASPPNPQEKKLIAQRLSELKGAAQ